MIQGKTVISDEVFVDIVKAAAATIAHVAFAPADTGSFLSLAKRVTDKMIPPIDVKKTEASVDENGTVTKGHVSFEVRVYIEYGAIVPEVVEALREAIVREVVSLTDFYVDRVDVIVVKLYRVKPAEAEPVSEPAGEK